MKIITFFLIIIFISGCTTNSVKLSSTPLPKDYEVLGESSAKACGFVVNFLAPVVFPVKWSMPYRAYTYAVNRKGGDALINVSIRESWYWCYVGNLYCTTVSGTVIKDLNK